MNQTTRIPAEATAILFVDDEPMACKWFARTFGKEFRVLTAGSVNQALEVLRDHAHEIAVLVTDFRMPERNGLELLTAARRDHRHVVRLLLSAFAEKDMAIAAVNEGQVFRILEKPLDENLAREALREAFTIFRQRALEQALHESRAAAMRETLGFVAHELNTPLAIVRGYMEELKARLQPDSPGSDCLRLDGSQLGQLTAMLNAAERSALHCNSLISTFVQSARDAYPGAQTQSVNASSLLKTLLEEYPFERDDERPRLAIQIKQDFLLPGRRDLLYLVLCTLTKNSLQVLRGKPDGRLLITVWGDSGGAGLRQRIEFSDNGMGIAPGLLARLSKEPVTTTSGGSGMGLLFCRRVVQSIGGTLEIASELGRGTTVTLHFDLLNETNPEEVIA